MFVPHGNPGMAPPPPVFALVLVVALVLYVWMVKYFVDDLYRPERRVAGGDKTLWLVIIVAGSVIGIAAYVSFGREC